MSEVSQDIENSKNKDEKRCNVRMADNKFLCTFTIETNDGDNREWYDYEKVFDTLNQFTDYLTAFFK